MRPQAHLALIPIRQHKAMGTASKWAMCIAISIAVAPLNAVAATLAQHGDMLHVSGALQSEDLLNRNLGGVRTVVFEQCLGGTVEAALKYVEVIRERRLNTLARGKCYSACAIAFLAGNERRAESETTITAVLLHVARKKTPSGEREFSGNDALMNVIDDLTGRRLTTQVRELVRSSWKEDAGVVFVFGPGFFSPRLKTLFCDGTQGMDTSKCQVLKNADAQVLGIVTTR